ncbi:hypothetical protein DIPPA_25195 [Diplonema papillatum]|nr:hypothetical protein DIPPA_25195 [Diplonema papillatum]
MKRAVRSVEELGLVPDVPYYALPMLYEEGGLFEGTRDDDPADHPPVHGITRDEVALSPAYPVNIDEIDWSAEGGWWPGGREDSSSIDRRVHEIADYLWKLVERRTKADETESKRGLLVVTHGLIHDRLKRLLITGSPAPTSAVFFPTSNAGIDVLDFKIHPQTSERMLAVIQLNNDAYLPPELRNGHTCGPFTIKYAN